MLFTRRMRRLRRRLNICMRDKLMGRTSMLVSFCRDQLPLGAVREARSDGGDCVDIRLLGGEGIEVDFHREDEVGIVAVRTEEGIGEGIMEGGILIDLGRGVRTGGV